MDLPGRRTEPAVVLVIAALGATAGDAITTFHAQAAGLGEATAWLSNLFERYPVGVGLLALYVVRASLVALGAVSAISRSYLSRVFGFVWLMELAVFGWYVVLHNLLLR